ncbi:class I SAM-dependent methyltransferase [Rhodoferax aquaticus]|uniref:Class I SAM-dependent methyltransferase n=1 Tax=Rhodoferax aquaticus TaxID=2527691 RepID=A0A515ETF8_9BURK|nr:SAM-dependent methyltransferase [Rhodoferax aquaticus]QDL55954.1 class I SAM-dependent methyltransferase [Rhodoferax aquaticus]
MTTAPSLPSPSGAQDAQAIHLALRAHLHQRIAAHGGWIGFDDFMAQALYAPGLGYYANGSAKFGQMPQGLRQAQSEETGGTATDVQGAGSDFVTAPEMTPLFGQALAQQVAQALQATGCDEIWEFGAGTGALAKQLLATLATLKVTVRRYNIVDLSDSLKARQQEALQSYGSVVHWVSSLPEQFEGVVVGNEVLDAMPVNLLVRKGGVWMQRGVVSHGEGFDWQDRATDLRPWVEVEGEHDYLTEVHPQAEAFVRTLGDRMVRGAVFFLDYGFPEAEYYHPQRHMGTVMCHQAHRSDADPLQDVGLKDITAHVNFTGIAVAAQDAGFELLGYTNQAHFLMNCGLVAAMQDAPLPERVAAQKLIMEHEMGELFKVIGFCKGAAWPARGFSHGDKTHRL